MNTGNLISDEFVRELRQLLRWRQNFKVVGGYGVRVSFKNGPDGAWVSIVGNPPPPLIDDKRGKTFLVLITAALAGGGKYSGTVVAGAIETTAGDDLSLPEGLTATNEVTVLNPEEDDTPTHWITPNSYVLCTWSGGQDKDNNRPLMTVSGPPMYRVAEPEAMGEGNGEDDTEADTRSWQRDRVTSDSNLGDTPVTLTIQTREAETEADEETGVVTRYGFKVTLTFDAGGRLYSISPETRYTISETEPACPPEEESE